MKALKQRKQSRKKTALKTSIGILITLVLLVGGAVGYIWYTGKDAANADANVKPLPKPSQHLIKPTQPKPDAVVSLSIQMLTTPVQAGGNASVTVKTNAGANCAVTVMYGTVASKDPGLKPKVADEFGTATWTWAIESKVVPGKYPVTITCANTKKSAMVKGDMVVEKASPAPAPATSTN